MSSSEDYKTKVNARLRRLMALHFDPDNGSPYWLERAATLAFDPRQRIRSLADLALFGPMEDCLGERPIEDFIPRNRLQRSELIVAQTGGTMGEPKFAVYSKKEFELAFVLPFYHAALAVDFPRELNWLYVGPTGPHIIGLAARACAQVLGSVAPFMIDLDPRWVRKLTEGSFARSRYQIHLEQQTLQILATQKIGVLFSTPPLLAALGEKIPASLRLEIKGIHFGGMAVSCELRFKLRELFPQAVMLSGFGNTLLGMAPEVAYSAGVGIDYAPWGERLIFKIVPEAESVLQIASEVEYGERGQIMAHRLDETQLIINLLERDSAIRIPAPGLDSCSDFGLDGLRDPKPLVSVREEATAGIY